MKKKIKFFIILAVVFIVGAVSGGLLMAFQYQRFIVAPFYSNALLEIAIDAQQLSKGISADVLKRKVTAMPMMVQSYHGYYYKFMPKDDSRYSGLWQVQKYYQISGDEVPASIKSILDPLPEKPLNSCELRRIKDGNSMIICEPNK